MSHHVYNLDDAVKAESRRPIDASWSPAKKRGVSAACIVLAAGAVGYGAWAMLDARPPKLPTTANEALVVINSAKFASLDPNRKGQYLEEAMRLVRELPEEQRRDFFQDEKNREAFRKFMEERFDDMARRFARGEELTPMFGPGAGGPRPPRTEGEQPRTPPTEEERAQRMEQMRNEMNKRIAQQIQSGNAQSGGLRGEMMKRMGGGAGGRGGWGGGRGGGGGGGGGAGGGGGGGGGGTGGGGSGSGRPN